MWNVNFSFVCSNRQNRNRTKTPIAAKWLRKVALARPCSRFLSPLSAEFHPRHECGSYPTAAFSVGWDTVSLAAAAPPLQLHFASVSSGCNWPQPQPRNSLIAGWKSSALCSLPWRPHLESINTFGNAPNRRHCRRPTQSSNRAREWASKRTASNFDCFDFNFVIWGDYNVAPCSKRGHKWVIVHNHQNRP